MLSYWTIPLRELIAEGINEDDIPAALHDRGGFQAICKAKRESKGRTSTDDCSPSRFRLFKRPPPSLSRILQEAVIVTEG